MDEENTLEENIILTNYEFDKYEAEGFAREFDTIYVDVGYNGLVYKVLGRCKPSTEGEPLDEFSTDLECLPMWLIEFADGYRQGAYPEEIIPSEIAKRKYL